MSNTLPTHPPEPLAEEQLPALIITPPGRYRHYKGKLYEVVGTVRHSETLEPMTLYRALYGEHGLWVRPAAMFNEMVDVDGTGGTVRQPRFARVNAPDGIDDKKCL
jgi:hypothetical protein